MLNKKNAPINSYDLSQIPDDGWYYDVEFSKKEDYLTNYKMLFSDRVLWALDRLSPEMRETLLLSLAGYRMQEIAVISHRSGSLDSKNVETVRSRYHGAKKRMRYLLSIYRE